MFDAVKNVHCVCFVSVCMGGRVDTKREEWEGEEGVVVKGGGWRYQFC